MKVFITYKEGSTEVKENELQEGKKEDVKVSILSSNFNEEYHCEGHTVGSGHAEGYLLVLGLNSSSGIPCFTEGRTVK